VDIFNRLESDVRSYCRTFPALFARASGPFLYDAGGRRYIDFFCGAGALNYGHNEPGMKSALLRYIEGDGVMHSLDLWTEAKAAFLERFERTVLAPRGLRYRVQFTGPTGANAVEAALKLARKAAGTANVIAFTGAYHGLSMGALSITGNAFYRGESFVSRANVSFVPYDGYLGPQVDTLDYLRRCLDDEHSGMDGVAAVFVETIQAEGGINVASVEWLRGLQAICRQRGIVLVVDDIQIGCGRTGTFFSFEEAGLEPDIVVLSKSISGYGLPMSLLLVRPDLDALWARGEHTGTFRGNNAAFVTAHEALRFWESDDWRAGVMATGRRLFDRLSEIGSRVGAAVRGRGLIAGLDLQRPEVTSAVAQQCFANGLIVETCGGGRVLKCLPPLNVPQSVLDEGLSIVEQSVASVCAVT
jgi:diaminobutyrate-2-oxoglutarate transaminase